MIDAVKDFNEYCEKNQYSAREVCGRCRQKRIVKIRTDIAKYMRSLGYSYPDIGHVMNRDHTSIIYLANDTRRAKRIKQMRAYTRLRQG